MQWITDSIQVLFGTTPSSETGLQKSGPLTKEQLLTFFDAGHKMFDDSTVKLRLKEAAERKQNVEYLITEMQKQIFESQGIQGTFGIGFLGKIRTVYGDDADIMQHLMQFVEREEMALDEAELTIDEFLKKLELKEWAVSQYHILQHQLKNMSPQEQRDFMHQQQLMMKEVNKESQEALKAAEDMSTEEKKKFISEQVQKIQARFQLKASECGEDCPSQDASCQHCTSASAPPLAPGSVGLGSSMTTEEQANFFKALYNTNR